MAISSKTLIETKNKINELALIRIFTLGKVGNSEMCPRQPQGKHRKK
jgi:hypothetical protein